MFKHSRSVSLSVWLLLVLVISMVRPVAVHADDSTPPPPATQEPTQPPVEESTAVPVPAAEEPTQPSAEESTISPVPTTEEPTQIPPEELTATLASATEEPTETPPHTAEGSALEGAPAETVVSDPVVDSQVPTEEPLAEEGTVGQLLDAAPDGTQVMVLDESGTALPLASEDAVEIVSTVDPTWCPAGTLPGGVGCSNNFGTISELINNMRNNTSNYAGDGTIYFTTSPGSQSFSLTDGSTSLGTSFDILKISNLTLQGGWNGLNDGSGFALSGQTDFVGNSVRVGTSLNQWVGNITINSISIDSANNTGLIVYTAGDITLNNVDSQNNAGNGAYLDNTIGNGDVTVQNSSFNNSRSSQTGAAVTGLRVLSKGNITVVNVTANNNTNNGALLENTSGTGNINLSYSSFIGNAGLGLEAYSNENIMLFEVVANENLDSGAYLENITGNGTISIDGSTAGGTSFSSNHVDGLEAYSNSTITLNNVVANSNFEVGGSLVNDTGEGDVEVSNSTFHANTSITGIGQNVGLEILSGGDVTLDNVSANGNLGTNGGSILGFSGLLVENSTFNSNEAGLYLEGEEAEIVCSQFNNNNAYGIDGLNVFVSFTLDDVIFRGNLPGDYHGSPFITSGGCESSEEGEEGEEEEEIEEVESEGGSSEPDSLEIVPLTGLPLHIVPVTGGEQIELDCTAFSGTKLILANGDSIILPCPIHDEGSLARELEAKLPGQLDDKFSFLSAMDAEVIRDGQNVPTLDTSMIIDFVIPDDQHSANLVILRWDASHSQWVEVSGGHVTKDGYFEAMTPFTGIFVLVAK